MTQCLILQMSMEKSCIWCNVHHLSMVNGETTVANRHKDRIAGNSNDLITVSRALRCTGTQCTWVLCLCQLNSWRVMVKYFNKSKVIR